MLELEEVMNQQLTEPALERRPSRHISRTLRPEGYLVDEGTLKRIESLGQSITLKQTNAAGTDGPVAEVEFSCRSAAGETLRFKSLDECCGYIRTQNLLIRSLRSIYERAAVAGLAIDYRADGQIAITAFGETPDLEFNVERIGQELSRANQEYPWWVRRILLQPWSGRVTRLILFFSSLGLLVLGSGYLYGLKFGINIDQTVVAGTPTGLKYYSAVAEALRSGTLEQKVDVLLYRELQNFTNVDEWLVRTQRQIVFLLVLSVLSAVDRHRGGGHPPTPATPPCVRVRTRRFEWVTLALLNQ